MAGVFDYVSHDDALLRIERYCLQEGKSAGTQMIRVSNAVGLELHIAVDRAMDITELRFRGIPLHYVSSTGITHPSYYEAEGYQWLRSFSGGFLTTCGLDQVGEPCVVENTRYGLHGRIANCPAKHVSIHVSREDGRLIGVVSGLVEQACQQGEAYCLRRTFTFYSDSTDFSFVDEVENRCGKPMPLQLLYHFNFGYPFLSPALYMELPPSEHEAWDEASQPILEKYADCTDSRELTVLHSLTNPTPNTMLSLHNGGIGMKLTFDGEQLPILGQWRLLQPREYVMAFEPTNTHLRGRLWEEENGTLTMLQPDEKKRLSFEVALSEDFSG